MEVALSKRDEIIRQLTTRLQSTASLQTDAEQLTHHVQQLQAQLINVCHDLWLTYKSYQYHIFRF